MNAALLAAASLLAAPAPTASLSAEMHQLFHVQKQELLLEIHEEFRADLRQQGARFFAEDGELHHLLNSRVVAAAELAAR